MEKALTVKDILTDIVKELGELNIPVSLVESIGIPIAKSINGLNLCISAMNEADAKAAEEEARKAETEASKEETEDQNA